MEIKKPQLSEIDRKRGKAIYIYLYQHRRFCTKAELFEFLGWQQTASNDRKLRELISYMAKISPVISTSDKAGYKLALDNRDLEEVVHQLNEHKKRISEIETRYAPLEEFIRKFAT